jgi:hypothetical protein
MKSLIKEEQPKLSRILVKIGYNLKVIKTEEICCFYSENKIVYAQTLERSFPTDFTLDELEEVLDEKTFFRVNRQFIISSDWEPEDMQAVMLAISEGKTPRQSARDWIELNPDKVKEWLD